VLLNARRHAAKRIAQLEKRGLKVEPLPNRGTRGGEPRTWFLRVGWRRHGLLNANEIPGALQP
jgi:hypothetical protein